MVISMKKQILFLLFPMIIILVFADTSASMASTSVPYDTYNYDYWGDIVHTPAAYIPYGSLTGENLGIGAWKKPQDFYYKNGILYLLDTDNHRIVLLDSGLKLVSVIDRFQNNGQEDGFKNPYGICVTEDGRIYVADTGNQRIVVLDQEGALIRLIRYKQSEMLPEDFVFTPLKVSVDYAGRVYVIAKNMYQGIMEFDQKDNFTGFTGTINVHLTPYEIFWRRFSTKEQRAKQKLYIATEFTGIDVDEDGFLYASNVDTNGKQSVRCLNPKGEDVIGKNERVNLSGDLSWRIAGEFSGASKIVDVKYRGKGIYSILDYTRGRIFTYNQEGDLLYIFGGMGSQYGTFKTPTAIEEMEGNIIVLDSRRNAILIFAPTKYGSLINEAVALRYDGDEAAAVEKWEEVLKLDSNFELAYTGIGKSYLAAGDNRAAMQYLKLGMERTYYSTAYRRLRNGFLNDNLNYILTGVCAAGLGLFLSFRIRKRKRREQ